MKKIRNLVIKIIIMIIISIILFWAAFIADYNKGQYLNSIDYYVVMNEDGSMNVVETWDIEISHTNTIFKNFKLSKTKYGDITDVEVKDLSTNQKLTNINYYMYHVPKNSYYGLEVKDRTFEIAWGVGMDDEIGNRKYQISYKVNDVVTDYKDCQEIYWQFLEEGENQVPAKKVTGTVILPENVSNIENLRVWGHGQLNGTIKKANENTVKFNMRNLNAGSMLEIRVVTEDKMFNVSDNKIREYHYLDSILDEEQEWADETNETGKNSRIILYIVIAIYLIIIISLIWKLKKYFSINRQEDDGIIKKELQYYRDIPRENTTTPAEATYLYHFDKTKLRTVEVQQGAVAATILDLCLKKKISLRVDSSKKVYVGLIGNEEGLQKDEKEIYILLKKVSKGRQEFELDDLNIYAKKNFNQYSTSINKLVNEARNSLYSLKLIDKANEKLYSKVQLSDEEGIKWLVKNAYLLFIVNYFITLIPGINVTCINMFGIEMQSTFLKMILTILPIFVLYTSMLNIRQKIKNKIAVLTQNGYDEREKWKGLAKYIENYSLLKEKEVPDLVVWEKYLVYATAFGIADKVIEQMKANYPEVFVQEYWNDAEMTEKYPVISFLYNPTYNDNYYNPFDSIKKINNNALAAYSLAQRQITKQHSSSSGWSSGSGGGGGFSSGGGGRRRPVVGMGGR